MLPGNKNGRALHHAKTLPKRGDYSVLRVADSVCQNTATFKLGVAGVDLFRERRSTFPLRSQAVTGRCLKLRLNESKHIPDSLVYPPMGIFRMEPETSTGLAQWPVRRKTPIKPRVKNPNAIPNSCGCQEALHLLRHSLRQCLRQQANINT